MKTAEQLDWLQEFGQPQWQWPSWITVQFNTRLHLRWKLTLQRVGFWKLRKQAKSYQAELSLPGRWQQPAFHQLYPFLVRWVELQTSRQTSSIKQTLREQQKKIWALAQQIDQEQGISPFQRKIPPLQPQGMIWNLEEEWQRVRQAYFAPDLECLVTWSKRIGGLSYHRKYLDEQGKMQHLISISRGYDHPSCPREALQGILYHEALHAVIPPYERNGRRIVHGPEFRRRERQFPHYLIWQHFHTHILPRLISQMRRSSRRLRKPHS